MRPSGFRLPHPAVLLASLLLLALCACAAERQAPATPSLRAESEGHTFIWPLGGWITAVDTYWTGKAHTLGSADINAPYGQPVVAARGGTVTEAGYSVTPRLGHYLRLAHEAGYETLYAHLLNTPFVRVGQRVEMGQELGRNGRTGNAGLAHLHFAVLKDGAALTPPEIGFGSWVNRGEPLPGLYPELSPVAFRPAPFTVRVGVGKLALKTLPRSDSATLAQLPQGTRLEVEGGQNGFYSVRHDALSGYVANSGVVPIGSPVYGIRTLRPAEARRTADASAAIVTTFPAGTVLTAFGLKNGFYKTQWRDANKFVHYVYLPQAAAAKTTHFWVRGVLAPGTKVRRGPGTSYEAVQTLGFSPYTPELLVTRNVQGWYEVGPDRWLPGWHTLRR
jgi:hypothetical protein